MRLKIFKPNKFTSAISPSSKNAGDATFTLTVNGTNFLNSSKVRFNGSDKTTTYVSATQLTAAIPSSDVSSGGSYSVSVFNQPSCRVVTDKEPWSIIISQDSNYLYVVNNGDNTLQKFNTSDLNQTVPHVTTDNYPQSVAVSHDGKYIYIVNETNEPLQKFDAANLNLLASATTGKSPRSVAIAPDGNYVYVANYTNKKVQQFYTPNLSLSESINADGNPTAITISPDGNYLYIASSNKNNIQKFSIPNLNLLQTTALLDDYVRSLVVAPDGNYVYAVDYFNLKKFNATNLSLVKSSSGGSQSDPGYSISVSPDGNYLYTINPITPSINKFSVSDLGLILSNNLASPYISPHSIAISADGNFIYVLFLSKGVTNNHLLIKIDTSTLAFESDGGSSNAQTFTVNNPLPTTTSISPTSKTAGEPDFTLTLNGTNFISTSVIYLGSLGLTTTYVSATQLTASLPVPQEGTYSITVVNPTPGGGTSNGQTFTVNAADNPAPTTTSISPVSKNVGDTAFTLTVNGTNFIDASVIKFNDSNRTTTYINSTKIRTTIPVSDLATAGTFTITVFNPTPGGGTSNGQTLTVNNPVPTTTSISPSSKIIGDPGFTLTVNGTKFVSTSTIYFDSLGLATTYVSATQLTADISTLPALGTYSITVVNPAPGGGTSNAQTFTVNNPLPTTTSIPSTSKNAGDTSFTLTVNGTNFISTSKVRFSGSDRTTTYVSATQLTATIPASDLATGGTFNITVFNPTPGGGTSNGQTFTVNNPVPTTTSISPNSATQNDPSFTLTVNGTNFVAASKVRFNGSDRTTTYISATQLTATIPASDLTSAGTFTITVFNLTPGGGTSNGQTFTVVEANPTAPTTTSISPTSKTTGSPAFTLTVNGTGFIPSSKVQFNLSDRTTTFVSPVQLTAAIPASDLTTGGIYRITVDNGIGGLSNAQSFFVNNPVPVTINILPSSAFVNGPSFVLTVNGSNFVSSSKVRFNESDRTTTFVSASQLTASIPSSDLETAGTYPITVFNPTPAGGISNSQNFTVVPGANPLPTTISISPNSATVGDPGFTLTVNGTNFISTSTIYFESLGLATTYISSTQLTTFISSTPGAGTYSVTVVNPAPGGGTSNAQTFTVNDADTEGPTISDLAVSSDYCPIVPATGIAYISWTYNNSNGRYENQFQMQIDDDPDFSSPEVNRTFSNLSNPPGSVNQQSVFIVTGFEPDSLVYGYTYYGRAKVWETDPDTGGPGADSGWVYNTGSAPGSPYATPPHPGPYASFTFSPSNPAPGNAVSFDNNSTCYDFSDPVDCQSYLWDFGDGGSSTQENPTHVYNTNGSFNVDLTASDELGSCQTNKTVPVSASSNKKLPQFKEVSPLE